jgi:hypothetical protein
MEQVRLQEPAGEPRVRRAWDWDEELTDRDREALEALREEAGRLRERIATLEADARRAAASERELRGALKWLAGARGLQRRRVLRQLREGKLV